MCLNYGVGEDSWESLDSKEIHPVHPKGDQSWVFIGRTDSEAETPILWPPHAKNWFIGKDPDAGKDWGQEEKGVTEDYMVGWHNWLDGHEFEQALGVGNEQGGLVCCSPWGCRVGHDWATELNKYHQQSHAGIILILLTTVRSKEQKSCVKPWPIWTRTPLFFGHRTQSCHLLFLRLGGIPSSSPLTSPSRRASWLAPRNCTTFGE